MPRGGAGIMAMAGLVAGSLLTAGFLAGRQDRSLFDLDGRDCFLFHLFSDSKRIPVTEIGVAVIRFFGYQ